MRAWYAVEPVVRAVREFFEDQWFDRSRRIRTSGNVSLASAGILAAQHRDSEFYMPARPRHIRQALRAVPRHDLSRFTYVDLGSGKGRTLFVAAEFPFRGITGVELSRSLHEQALANLRRFRLWKQRCRCLESIHANASDFAFPETDLVLYMFNPFGRSTMQQVLRHLSESLRNNPRHAIVILLWPRAGDLVAAVEGMHLRRETTVYQIFEANP